MAGARDVKQPNSIPFPRRDERRLSPRDLRHEAPTGCGLRRSRGRVRRFDHRDSAGFGRSERDPGGSGWHRSTPRRGLATGDRHPLRDSQLEVPHRTRTGQGRTDWCLRQRANHRGQWINQCDGLRAGAPSRLRRLGGSRRDRVVLPRRAPPLQGVGELGRRTRPLSRRLRAHRRLVVRPSPRD